VVVFVIGNLILGILNLQWEESNADPQ
jgi:hypothetical protein